VLSELIRPSGGLYYHAKALVNGRRWRPFREEIRLWLETWPCDKKQDLLLIGPSAGYTLPSGWLKDFPKIHAFDLDPLSGPLFRRRHGVNAEFHRVNLFWSGGTLSIKPLKEVLREYPKANILFCNVLGQVLLEGKAGEEEWLSFLRQLRFALRGRTWASYHDVLSLKGQSAVDHMTAGEWCADLPTIKMTWKLGRNRIHKIDAVWSTQGSS
jgi:hypothetical protein